MNERKRISRRAFLARTASAVAAPYVVPAGVLGQSSSRRTAEDTPPSDRIGVAFLGCGRRGYTWISYMSRMPQVRCVAVCDVSQRARDTGMKYAARRQKGCNPYKDYREVLDLKDVDAVVIATPDHWHAAMAVQAAKAGKDVFCESPLSLTVREARQIARAARRYGRVFQVGTDRRSNSRYVTACEIVQSQQLGEIKTVHVQAGPASSHCYYAGSKVPSGFDWDMWLGPAPEAPYHPYRCSGTSGSSYGWRAWRDYCGGRIASYGSHYFDTVHWALGLDDTGPVEIVPADGKDTKVLAFRYANGLTVYNGKGPKGALIELTGSVGTLGIGVESKAFQTWPEEVGLLAQKAASSRSGRRRDSSSSRYSSSTGHVVNWLECIRTRGKCVSDVEAACRSVTVSHLGCIATWLNRPIKWDPLKEEIVGDPQAGRWLDRPKRAPWRV